MTVDQLREHVEYLKRCCLHLKFDTSRIAKVLFAYDSSSTDGVPSGTERSGFWVFKTTDRRFGVVSDSEDYTGHG